MLTLQELKDMEPVKVFATGTYESYYKCPRCRMEIHEKEDSE